MAIHKKYSNTHLKVILSDVIIIALEHIKALYTELSKIDLQDKDLPKEVGDRAQLLSHVLTIINDIIHPAHSTALTLLPGGKEIIEMCIKNQQLAIDKKLISPNCVCYECGIKKDMK